MVRNYSVVCRDMLRWIRNNCRNPAETFCRAKCVTAYDHVPLRKGRPDVATGDSCFTLSGEHSVPWSSLWQRVILASSTSGPGWSSTCLHHCRGLRMISSCSSALGLTYNLECTIKSTIQSGCLHSRTWSRTSFYLLEWQFYSCYLKWNNLLKQCEPIIQRVKGPILC